MSAGLPGLGLGGLFFILSALLAPFIEIGRMAIGRRREVNWPQVWRQFAQALTMIAAVDLTLRLIYALSHVFGLGDTPRLDVITVIPLIPVAITGCLLAAVLLTAKAVDVATPVLRGMPRLAGAFPSRTRVLAGTGVVGAIWFALLFSGANDLSQLPGREGGTETDKRSGAVLAEADDAGETLAVAGVSDEGAPVATGDVVNEPSAADRTSAAGADAGAQGTAPASDIGAGSTAPAAAPASAEATVPAETVEPTQPAPSASSPDFAGPAEEPAPADPPTDPGSTNAGPPADSGPPESAGPPEQSNAPDHAGPG